MTNVEKAEIVEEFKSLIKEHKSKHRVASWYLKEININRTKKGAKKIARNTFKDFIVK